MIVVKTIKELTEIVNQYTAENNTIGFVPTMGYLHEGHIKLLTEAKKANDKVVLSIFVNPLQFGPNEDYDAYPRDTLKDEETAKHAGVDLVFLPNVNEMYPTSPSYTVSVKSRVDALCGRSREGHFDGVATIVTKLFNLIKPNRAYFGMKDAQQVAVIDGLIKEFNFPIELIAVETIREKDGLAKSSRNVYLSEKERSQAPSIYNSLLTAKSELLKGEQDIEKVRSLVSSIISQKTKGAIDYIEILSYPELEDMEMIKGKIIIAIAVKFTKARLIDNITIDLG